MAINSIEGSRYYTPAVADLWSRSANTATDQVQKESKTSTSPPPPSMFSGIDVDQSGGVDQSEFDTLLSQISETSGKKFDAEELFTTYDSDADDTLSEEEVTSFLEANKPAPPPPPGGPNLADIYTDADEDGDGSIDSEEAQSLVDMINHATGQDLSAEELIQAFDEDADEVLNEEEALTALEENQPEGSGSLLSAEVAAGLFEIFNATDADSDGTISSEEAESLITMINDAITQGLTVANLMQAFDDDTDGVLSGIEALSALIGNQASNTPEPAQMNTGVSHYLNTRDLLNSANTATLNTAG